jgi:hypothetical protein
VARFLARPPHAIATAASTATSGLAQCSFTAEASAGTRIQVTATIDTSPQPYARLERTVEETAQNAATSKLVATPEHIPGLGLDADWFPQQQQLMTTDGARLIAVTIDWRQATQARQQALAAVVARNFLGRLEPHALS